MKTSTLSLLIHCCLALCHAATAWGATSALIRITDIRQNVQLEYDFRDLYSKSREGSEYQTTRNATKEKYNLNIGYNIYSSRLLRGSISLGLEAEQASEKNNSAQWENSTTNRLNYDINGTFFRAKPYPVSFFLDSNLNRVNPAYARSYDLKTDHYGANFQVRNRYLPFNVSYIQNINESSGLTQDRRDTQNVFGFSIAHLSQSFSTTTAAVQTTEAHSETISGKPARDMSNTVTGNLTNHLNFSGHSLLTRDLSSSFRIINTAGDRPLRHASWNEDFNWSFGKGLKTVIQGEWKTLTQENQTREDQQIRATLEHRLFESLTSKISTLARQSNFDPGKESEFNSGISFGYQKKLPRESNLFIGYGYNYGIVDTNLGADTLFNYNDRLNVGPVETDNYLTRTDVVISTIVVYNTSRTRIYTTADYTPVQDGRRTRIRIESGSSINVGDAISVDYSINANPQIKTSNTAQSVSAAINLWREYKLAATFDYFTQDKLAGRDDVVPLSPTKSYSTTLERTVPTYTLGTNYTNFDSNFARYQKMELYWKYRREFERNTLSAHVSDILSIYERTGAGPTVSEGGTSNAFLADATLNRTLNERLNLNLIERYEKSTGRSTDLQIISTLLQARFRAARLESTLTARMDFRYYQLYSQRDYSLTLNLRRNF